jgi:hypothetical protein
MQTTTNTRETMIAAVRQIDGRTRYLYAQDPESARRARDLLRLDRSRLDALHGIDGIQVRISYQPPSDDSSERTA